MDGVIIDSEPMHFRVNQEIFKELDIEVSKKEYNNYIGTSNTEMWTQIKQKHNLDEEVSALAKKQQTKNMEHVKKGEVKPVSGVLELIKSIANSQLKMALGSSSPRDLIEKVIKTLEIKDLFDVIASGEEVNEGKPAPDLFLEIADKLKIDEKNIIVIEDSENGVKAAKQAGMKCIGFSNENSGFQDLSAADWIIFEFNKKTKNIIFE